MNNLTADDFLNQQQALEDEARELMPWDPKHCTYSLGALKQQVYACRTHGNIGVCYSCSIRCHTSCDIVELFTKRNFTCDCGTERDSRVDPKSKQKMCEIRENREPDIAASDNSYGPNFKGLFCDCAQEYDADSPTVMIQCVMGNECGEDWYHDHCIMGVEADSVTVKPEETSDGDAVGERHLENFPALDSFDAFICWKCVSKYAPYFQKIESSELANDIVSQTVIHGKDDKSVNAEGKRTRDDDTKPYSIFLKKGYQEALGKLSDSIKDNHNKLHIFLTQIAPQLIKDEEEYEPPAEEETILDIISKSLYQSINRAELAAGSSALYKLQSNLKDFLQPFAKNGKVVKEEDIASFFQKPK